MKKSPVVLACLLLCAATASSAMSLGRNRGAAIIGRPLDISVQAILDTQEDPASLCLEADVFYADTRVNRSSVRVSAERSGPGATDAVIRIRSFSLIDEPVVSIYLRAGCLQKTERRYVILSDLVSDPAPDTGVASSASGFAVSPPAVTPAIPRPATAAAAAGGQTGAGASGAARVPGSRPRGPAAAGAGANAVPDDGAVATPAPPKRPAAPARAATGGRAAAVAVPRLKLEPLDLTVDRDPTLKSTLEMRSTPTASDQERTVAAALWRAINARPEDFQQDAEKLRNLENSINTLRAQTQKNQQAIGDLNIQLQQAQSERYANGVVYTLGGLLLLALSGLLFVWRRKPSSESTELPWWRKGLAAEKGWSNSLDAVSVPPSGLNSTSRRSRKPTASVLDLDLGLDPSAYAEVRNLSSGHSGTDSVPPLSRRDRSDFAMSMTNMSRAVKAEELFDVQQQADFFVSLGQHDQAIQVLRSHIGDNTETSALVFLDLFNLYHQLGRRDDFEALRGEFGQQFNANVPEFDLYSDASAGIEAYEQALGRIIALWPSPKVLDVIEESIFKKPEAGVPPFDLEAYRELLLLYTVAKEIIGPDALRDDDQQGYDLRDSVRDSGSDSGLGNSRPRHFSATAIQPLSASTLRQQAASAVDLSAFPRPSPRLGLDIDLTEMVGEVSPPEPAPAVPAAPAAPAADADSRFFDQFVADIEGGNALDDTRPGLLPPPAKPVTPPVPLSLDPGNLIDFHTFDSSGGLPDDDDLLPPPKR